jgi:APA family basic amino acid/polyamine antiporter
VLYGQTRILFAMARDGLIPKIFEKVDPRRQVPVANTLIVAAFVSVLAGFIPLGQLAEATSIGTLFAFAIVNVGVLVLRRTRPDLPRSFRTPFFPITPILGVIFCVIVMLGLAGVTWLAFALWMLVGLGAYFLYGYRHSRLNRSFR